MNNNKRLKDTGTLAREIFLEHPDWNSRQIYDRYLILIGDTNKAVTLNAIQKHVQVLRKRYQKIQDTGIDLPWSLDKTSDLPAEAIAAIFEVQAWLEKAKDSPMISSVSGWTETMTNGKMNTNVWPITIREALWISKFYNVKYNLSPPEKLYFTLHNKKQTIPNRMALIENPYKLWDTAKTYADYQRLCEIAGIAFDTMRLDEALRKDIGTGRTKYELFKEQGKEGEK